MSHILLHLENLSEKILSECVCHLYEKFLCVTNVSYYLCRMMSHLNNQMTLNSKTL